MDDYGTEVAGSLGDVDLEYVYPPKSERIICAADDRHTDHEKRLAALETQVHRLLHAEPDMGPSSDITWRRGFEDGKAFERRHQLPARDSEPIGDFRRARGAVPFEPGDEPAEVIIRRLRDGIATQPKADYALIPIAEWLDIKEELEALRAFKIDVSAAWDGLDSTGCNDCDGNGGSMVRCIDNPDVWQSCETCNGHGLLYARPKEA